MPSRLLPACAWISAALLASCAPRSAGPAHVDLPAPACAPADTAPLVEARAPAIPGLAALAADPNRIWIHEEQSGLNVSLALDAQLLRSGDHYDAACLLHVKVSDPQGFPLPARFEEKWIEVPLPAVRALTTAVRRAKAQRRRPGLVTLEPLDSHRASDVLFFTRDEAAPLHLSLEPPRSFLLHLDGPYRLADSAEVYGAYQAILAALDLDRWFEVLQRAARAGGGP